MGACTKIGWTRLEGRPIDTLFCHGLVPVDTYIRYLKEYSAMIQRGERPTVAVGVYKDGVLDYEFTDKVELLVNSDTFVLGTTPNFNSATWYEMEDMFRTDDNRRIEKYRRVVWHGSSIGTIQFDSGEDAIDHIIGNMEEQDGH